MAKRVHLIFHHAVAASRTRRSQGGGIFDILGRVVFFAAVAKQVYDACVEVMECGVFGSEPCGQDLVLLA